jgi:hypothetical protein
VEIPTLSVAFESAMDFDALLDPEADSGTGSDSAKALETSIDEDIAAATEALLKHDATIAEEPRGKFRFEAVPQDIDPNEPDGTTEPSAERAPPNDSVSTVGSARVANSLSNARTLDDVDDQMAESLFNTHIGMLAGLQVDAAGTETGPTQPSKLELELVEDDPPVKAVQVSVTPAMLVPSMPLTASQRLRTVLALNARKPIAGRPVAAPQPPRQPLPIEDQIRTALPTTREALNAGTTSANDDDDHEVIEKRKGGFFSRFRRS